MLRPASRAASQIQLWEKMWDDPYVKSFRMFKKWSTQVLPLAGEYFRQTTKELMWDNKLYEGKLTIKGRPADIKNITVPVFHADAEHDHIVPYAAAQPLVAGVSSVDKEEIMLKGGHVSLIAGSNAVKRLWPKLDSWFKGVRYNLIIVVRTAVAPQAAHRRNGPAESAEFGLRDRRLRSFQINAP